MRALLALSDAANRVLERIASLSGWLFLVLMGVICFDVLTRKVGYQIPGFGSTMLQELEWHLHTVIFSMWLGYNYVINSHPRVDSYTDGLSLRSKAFIELAGCLIFAFPYTYILLYHGVGFVAFSYQIGEGSEAVIGLSHRWIIKSFLYVGLVLLMLAIVSMTLRLFVYLFGPPQLRERAKPPLTGNVLSEGNLFDPTTSRNTL
jgi:TRAP-type mannitol/chloroaromatic compound transport system permease small subunit